MGVFLKMTCFRQAVFSICNFKINGNTSSESAKMNVRLVERPVMRLPSLKNVTGENVR